MKKIVLVLVGLSFLLGGCAGRIGDDLKYLECIARDNTSRPCN